MNVDDLLIELDAPRPLPRDIRAGLERALVEREYDRTEHPRDLALERLDVPRPMSARARAAVESALVVQPRAHRWVPHWVVATAAAVALIAGFAVLARGPADAIRPQGPVVAGPAGGPPHPAEMPPGLDVAPSLRTILGIPPRDPVVLGPSVSRPPTNPSAPVPIAVVGGDAAQEAGFRAYVQRFNAAGGARTIELVEAGDRGAVATVNLSPDAIAHADGPPRSVRGPLLETLAVPEDALHGRVFSMASSVERQAHLLAAKVFPAESPASTAVVYRGTDGVYAREIPRALRDALEERRVNVVEFTYVDGQRPPLVVADAVFLSLDQQDTLGFLAYARAGGYNVGRIACIFPMLDEGIVDELADGYLVLSPYTLGTAAEARSLREASGRPLSSATIHGWVTAKALVRALETSESGADLTDALRALSGFEHGFGAPYATRSGSNVRTPDGILYEVQGDSFVARDGSDTAAAS